MASKFQNRLVGTIIIVALGVIILPGLLDGKKKHYKEEFAAIPLVPKPGDQQETDMVPPVTQSLPAHPPASLAPEGSGNDNPSRAESGSNAPHSSNQPTVVTPPPVQQSRPEPEPVKKPAPAAQPKPQQPKPVEKPTPVEKPKPQPKPETAPVERESAPTGQAWVVQLGALKNAAKVDEIVAKLRLSGYRAFTVPASPVQGQITRIYVGPDASKAKLQGSIGELKGLSGLSGVIKPYSVR
ncbi:cell division protein DedD [Pantoea sp. FN060301]|uniref:cell division protein DedD n=1 Tax=Pantoea sp. FN060301 TaxID=3420380 RepID=UPI003D179B33